MTFRVTMAATIPVAQYGNLQPTFEVEADTHEEAMDKALDLVKDVWDRTAKEPLVVKDLDKHPGKFYGKELRCWASGTRVIFDPIEHTYETDGKLWLSGSTFAGKYKSEFNAPLIAGKMAAKNDVAAQDIIDMWALNRDTSSTVGSSVHMALQLRGEYGDLSKAVKNGSLESALTKNPILLPIVNAFFATREHEDARYEVFVADPARKHCGFIDRLVIEPDGSLIVEDYKTNSELLKAETILTPFKGIVPNTKLGAYWLQLSFYARILQAHGYTVKALRVHHWVLVADEEGDETARWVTYEHEPIDLDAAFAKP